MVGRLAALAVMVVLVSVGLGALLLRSELLFTIIEWTGVAYLLYLGLQSLWSSWRTPAGPTNHPAVRARPPAAGLWALGREEFLVAGTNPKAIVLFGALLPQSVPGPGSLTAGLLLVGAVYLAVSLIGFAGYFATGRLPA